MYIHRDKKSGIYKYRREYPSDIINIGKKWFIRTLDTKDAKTANQRFAEADREFQDIVNQHKVSQYTIPDTTQKLLLPILQTYHVRPFSIRSKTISFSELSLASRITKERIITIYEKIALHGEDNRYGKLLSKSFNEYLIFLKIKPKKEERILKDFHSFRHLFKTECRRAKIPKHYHDRLTGHTSIKTDAGDDYGEHPLTELNDCMQSLRYQNIDLTHLYLIKTRGSS